MTSHPHKAGFSVVALIKTKQKKKQALHENQQEQEMGVAVPSPILKPEKLYIPSVHNSGLLKNKIKIIPSIYGYSFFKQLLSSSAITT